MKSKKWLDRQKNDIFVKEAIKKNYLSRSAFKLLEIDKKYKLISKSNIILELGSSPGGWSQVVCQKNNKAYIHAFDIKKMNFINPRLKFYNLDFVNFEFKLLKIKYDLILSDIAPNTTGHKNTDHLKIISIVNDIISILDTIILKKGNFVFKILKGSEENDIIYKLKKKFRKVS